MKTSLRICWQTGNSLRITGKTAKPGDVWDCLLVQQRDRTDGVLVLPEQGCFVSWAAYVSEVNI